MATAQLCSAGEGARCVDVAARLNVSKAQRTRNDTESLLAWSCHQKRYGIVRLTPEGEAQAKLCEACYAPLYERMHAALAPGEGALPQRCAERAFAVL